MIRDDIFCYRNFFVIDPGYSFKNGAGYAIFSHETHRLIACGVVRPFAPGLNNFVAVDEMSRKLRKVWEEEIGFSFDPALLCIEFPRVLNHSNINSDSLLLLSCLAGMIRRDFRVPIERVYFARPGEWKGNSSKNQTEHSVMLLLDAWSRKVLATSVASLPKTLHHNVYDAIGLGLWAIEKFKTRDKPSATPEAKPARLAS